MEKSMYQKKVEARSYDVPFKKLQQPVYWFHDIFQAGTWSDRHRHDHWGELAFAKSGYFVICTPLGNYIAPPHVGVWIPPGLDHEWYLPEAAIDCSLFICPQALAAYPRFQSYHALNLSSLLQELIIFLARQNRQYTPQISRLVNVILDQLPLQPILGSPLLMPKDRRFVALCIKIIKDPEASGTIKTYCKQMGMSERTLTRQFKEQTGETFGHWRQKIRLQYAATKLKEGENVTEVAFNCGYKSVSSFILAFKKRYGHTPGRAKDDALIQKRS